VVTFIDPLNRQDAEELIKIRQRLGRKFILNVCDSCTEAQVAEIFNAKKIIQIGPSSSNWKIWQISDN
jgi:DNA-binding GntR family transcriptional regulator